MIPSFFSSLWLLCICVQTWAEKLPAIFANSDSKIVEDGNTRIPKYPLFVCVRAHIPNLVTNSGELDFRPSSGRIWSDFEFRLRC